ncbi:U1 small nuclear ribonucleoprotein C [Diospyros lotus]|uniref:U1 small nuclear ribonucleoprotein C n=1 Tax=Diospyros lotus TaxID=55363 RepID=UPI00224D76B1|nr:U1 small nuclear ribonucleoprotein C [Diospyros lotus]
MPRYYCDYCDTYLTHDSPSVRKQHNAGYKHKANIRSYYQQFEAQQNQILLDQKIKEHLGQTATYQQVGVAFNPMRPPMPVLPTPSMPMAGNPNMNSPLIPGVRPPILPRPIHGYMPAPGMSPMIMPPGAAPFPLQVNSLPRPPTMTSGPAAVPGPPMANSSSSTPAMYQANSAPTTSGGFDSST